MRSHPVFRAFGPEVFPVAILALLLPAAASAIDVVGTNTGPIPDNDPTGRTVSFNVAGMTSDVTSVELLVDLTHTFAGDLHLELRSPGGVARLVVFSRIGVQAGTTFGAAANLGGSYRFADDAPGDLRAVAAPLPTAAVVPPGRYRTLTGGVAGTLRGGCSTWLAGAFAGLDQVQSNGTWTLTVSDRVSTDTGTINSALLSVRGSQDDLFGDDFDPWVRGTCQAARMDYTGTGRTSYVLVRNTGGGAGGTTTWFVKNNDGTAGGSVEQFPFGVASDYFVDGDFDGDGLADAAVWRAGATGQFLVRRSSRPGDVTLVIPWGQAGDDPAQIGDFDGDRIDDATVYRAGAQPGDVSRTLVRTSGGGPHRDFVTGQNGQFASIGGDYNGDGLADIAIQSNAGGGQGAFNVFSGANGALLSTFLLGTPTDVIILGNHVGSPRADTTVARGVAGQIQWTTRNGETGALEPPVSLGPSATSFLITGDYDGDGLDDYAYWGPSASPGQSQFVVRRSSAPGTPLEVPHGQNGDYPVANNRVH